MTERLQSGAATCERGFVKCFPRVPQAVTAAAMLPKQARGTFRKHVTQPHTQVGAPDCIQPPFTVLSVMIFPHPDVGTRRHS